jgi:hypothetical protein
VVRRDVQLTVAVEALHNAVAGIAAPVRRRDDDRLSTTWLEVADRQLEKRNEADIYDEHNREDLEDLH